MQKRRRTLYAGARLVLALLLSCFIGLQSVHVTPVFAEDEQHYAGADSGVRPKLEIVDADDVIAHYKQVNSSNPKRGELTKAKLVDLFHHTIDAYRIYKTDPDKLYDSYKNLFEWVKSVATKNVPSGVDDAYVDMVIGMYDKKASDGTKNRMGELATDLAAAKDKAPAENKDRIQAAIDKLNEFKNQSGNIDFANTDVDKVIDAANKLIADPSAKPEVPGYTESDPNKDAANKFKEDNKTILAKDASNVTEADEAAVNKALDDYAKLSPEAQKLLATEKTKLDDMKKKIDELKAQKAQADANKFKEDNKDILAKDPANVTKADEDAVNKALADYEKLSPEAKDLVKAEKAKLDEMKKKIDEIKAAEKVAKDAADKFKTDNKEILSKDPADVTEADEAAVDKALADYNNLSEDAKKLVADEKAKLDDMKKKIEADKARKAQAETDANKFKEDNKDILAKDPANVTKADEDAVNKALADYEKLSPEAKDLVKAEKAKLDEMKKKIDEIKAAEKAANDAADKFKADNKDVLAKESANVTESDEAAVDKALADYNNLSEDAKKLVPAEKAKLDEMKKKIEADKAKKAQAEADANKFKEDNKDILAKDPANVTKADEDAVNKALADYEKLSPEAKELVKAEKAKLDEMKKKIDEIKAAEKAANDAADKFKADNKDILAKEPADVTEADETAVDKALADYNNLSEDAKKLVADEKVKLDDMKKKIEERKAAAQATKDAADKFKVDNKDILAKESADVTESDEAAVDKALADYNNLSEDAKKLVADEKAKLDDMKKKIEERKAAEKAANDAADKFKADNKDILSKDPADVTEADEAAVDKALADYNNLSEEAKKLVADEKAKLDEMKKKIEADKAKKAEEAVNKFKEDNKDILAKDSANVTEADEAAVDKALADYEKLSDDAKKLVPAEKAKLDEMKKKIEGDKAKKAQAETDANKFKEDNKVILAKDPANVTKADEDAVNKALADYEKLSPEAKELVKAEKAKLDEMKKKIDEIKAAEKAASDAADKFKADNKEILAKDSTTATEADEAAVDNALADYNNLSEEAKKLVPAEKAKLDEMKKKIEAKKSEEAANKFKEDNKDILAKDPEKVTAADKTAVEKALVDYDKLSEDAKKLVTAEKAKLDEMKKKLGSSTDGNVAPGESGKIPSYPGYFKPVGGNQVITVQKNNQDSNDKKKSAAIKGVVPKTGESSSSAPVIFTMLGMAVLVVYSLRRRKHVDSN